jgi:hypothetical protein
MSWGSWSVNHWMAGTMWGTEGQLVLPTVVVFGTSHQTITRVKNSGFGEKRKYYERH